MSTTSSDSPYDAPTPDVIGGGDDAPIAADAPRSLVWSSAHLVRLLRERGWQQPLDDVKSLVRSLTNGTFHTDIPQREPECDLDAAFQNKEMLRQMDDALFQARQGPLSQIEYNRVLKYVMSILYFRCFQSNTMPEITLREFLDAKITELYVIIVHDHLISIPLTHFEWGYLTNYVRFVRPQLATDAKQPDRSRLIVNFDQKALTNVGRLAQVWLKSDT